MSEALSTEGQNQHLPESQTPALTDAQQFDILVHLAHVDSRALLWAFNRAGHVPIRTQAELDNPANPYSGILQPFFDTAVKALQSGLHKKIEPSETEIKLMRRSAAYREIQNLSDKEPSNRSHKEHLLSLRLGFIATLRAGVTDKPKLG